MNLRDSASSNGGERDEEVKPLSGLCASVASGLQEVDNILDVVDVPFNTIPRTTPTFDTTIIREETALCVLTRVQRKVLRRDPKLTFPKRMQYSEALTSLHGSKQTEKDPSWVSFPFLPSEDI